MKKNIAVIYGGYSSEYQISIESGKHVASLIDKNLFNVYEVLIKKDTWQVVNGGEIDKNDFSALINNKKIRFDAAVIVIHGNPGENGILQSYFELIGLPYVSCNPIASMLTFNKIYCNKFLQTTTDVVKIAPSFLVRKNQNFNNIHSKVEKELGYPIFVKPNAGGSSFGTTKVKTPDQLLPAIEKAFEESQEVLLEKYIKGRELTCAVLKKDDEIKALTPLEVVSKHEFFDYEAKYNSDLNQEIVPAPVPEKILQHCKLASETIYKILNCNGIVRIDYILTEDEDLYFLEVNSIPGMTAESIVPKIAKYDNINLTDIYTQLIINELEKK